MLASCGNSVQPAAEADECAGGPVDVPDAVQQPAPAAQRPGACQMGDGLLDQRAQPCLQAIVGPLLRAEAVDDAAVPNRGMPVPARLGHAAESAVQQACDLELVEQLAKPCQRKQLVLVAAARPATVAPQQVAVDGRDGKALGGVIVSEMLGHSQIGITLDLYSHVPATMQQEAVRAFEGLFGSQEGVTEDQNTSSGPVAQSVRAADS